MYIEGTLIGLGQTPERVVSTIAAGQPAEVSVMDSLRQEYGELRQGCIDRFGEDFCNSILPQSVFYATQDGEFRIPAWVWFFGGFIVAKVLRL